MVRPGDTPSIAAKGARLPPILSQLPGLTHPAGATGRAVTGLNLGGFRPD